MPDPSIPGPDKGADERLMKLIQGLVVDPFVLWIDVLIGDRLCSFFVGLFARAVTLEDYAFATHVLFMSHRACQNVLSREVGRKISRAQH